MLYAVKTPKGKILEATVSLTHSDAVLNLFWRLCASDKGWESRYWKRWEPAKRAAYKLGWRIVKVKVTEVK